MSDRYTPPKLTQAPFPDLFTLVSKENSHRPLVQTIREHLDAPTDSIRFTWGEVLQHAQNTAANLRSRWADRLRDNARNPRAHANVRVPGESSVVVGVLATNGYELYVNIIACTLNRWTVLLISPKNSPAAIEHLLRTSKSSLFLVEPSNIAFGHTMEHSLPGLTSQAVENLDPPETGPAPSPLSPLTKEQLEEEMELPAFYLHTSGSTGHPKIVQWSHRFMLSGIRARQGDSDDWIGLPFYCIPPLIHAMGMTVHFMYSLAHGNLLTFVSAPTPKPPSAASLLSYIPFIQGGIVMLPPSILEDLHSLGPDAVEKVAKGTKSIVFSGAPLPVATGDALVAAGMNISARYGSTEIGIGTTLRPPKSPKDWQYVYCREGYQWHFLPIDDHSNLRELIVGPGLEDCPAVINHENPRGYATNDIWEPHPTVPNLWKHHSRKGDVTVLSNGEKSDNRQIENLLLKDKRILHVQVFGAGRPMNGVVIQPADPASDVSNFVLQIRTTIEHANSILPRHSMLVPELIIIAKPDRPFATTDKGTVKRKETLELFEREIERAYDALDESGIGLEWVFEGRIDEEGDILRFVRAAVHSMLGREVPDQGDLFENGLDSLLAVRLRGAILTVVSKTTALPNEVTRNVVYTYPTIIALTNYTLLLATPGRSNAKDAREERIRRSIAKYSADFIPHTPGFRSASGKVIALSGSTGSVGSSFLGLLLKKWDVEKVYLLNRKGSESQKVRQASALTERGLDPRILDIKVNSLVYLDVDFSRRDLGLAEKDYKDLRDNVTHIIHAAWHLNFNLILESYEHVHIAGVRHLVNLALSSPHAQPPRFTFLSTVAAAGMYQGPSQEPSEGEHNGQVLIPETPIDNPGIAMDQGYGQSKYVSERVLVNAVKAGLRTTIIRIGQLSGVTTNGAWATTEHVPIMLRSSLKIGLVPNDLPAVRWIPSDIAASAILKQAFMDHTALDYYSIENPFPTPWHVIVQVLSASSTKPMRAVTLRVWLEHIMNSNPDTKEVPATKLLDFYQRIAQGVRSAALGWEQSLKVAPELAVGSISTGLVEKYVIYQQGRAEKL